MFIGVAVTMWSWRVDYQECQLVSYITGQTNCNVKIHNRGLPLPWNIQVASTAPVIEYPALVFDVLIWVVLAWSIISLLADWKTLER
jgi:hypothetical protein